MDGCVMVPPFYASRKLNSALIPNRACDTAAMTLSLIVILPFAAALIAGFLPSHARNTAVLISSAVTSVCTLLIVSLFSSVTGGAGVIRERCTWAPQLGLDLYLRMDGYAWLFALLVSFMGLLVVLYARYYMSQHDPVPRFFSFLLAFHGRDARRGALGQRDSIGNFLGADQLHLVHADRVLVSPRRCPAWRANGADRHRYRPG